MDEWHAGDPIGDGKLAIYDLDLEMMELSEDYLVINQNS